MSGARCRSGCTWRGSWASRRPGCGASTGCGTGSASAPAMPVSPGWSVTVPPATSAVSRTGSPTTGRTAGQALWRRHRERVLAALGRVRLAPALRPADPRPWAVRALALLVLVVAVHQGDAGQRLLRLRAGRGRGGGLPIEVSLWVTPLHYTATLDDRADAPAEPRCTDRQRGGAAHNPPSALTGGEVLFNGGRSASRRSASGAASPARSRHGRPARVQDRWRAARRLAGGRAGRPSAGDAFAQPPRRRIAASSSRLQASDDTASAGWRWNSPLERPEAACAVLAGARTHRVATRPIRSTAHRSPGWSDAASGRRGRARPVGTSEPGDGAARAGTEAGAGGRWRGGWCASRARGGR